MPQPTWEIAQLFPPQGGWTEQDYLALDGNHLVEFSEGRVEVLPAPTERHQMILGCLYLVVHRFLRPRGLGLVLFSPLRVRLWEGKIREPDLIVLLKENEHLRGNQFWRGADLVLEIVSPDDPKRDLEVKRDEYARAGIREYWIVDPRDETIRVFCLHNDGEPYTEAGIYRRGEQAVSILLAGLTIDVDAVFSQDRAAD